MNRHFIKSLTVATVSFVLLYYSVAWAILRCHHDEKHAVFEASLLEHDRHDQLSPHFSAPSHASGEIDCLEFEYHFELLTGPASPLRNYRATTGAARYLSYLFTYENQLDGQRENILKCVFARGSTPKPSDPPPYLFFSTLRI